MLLPRARVSHIRCQTLRLRLVRFLWSGRLGERRGVTLPWTRMWYLIQFLARWFLWNSKQVFHVSRKCVKMDPISKWGYFEAIIFTGRVKPIPGWHPHMSHSDQAGVNSVNTPLGSFISQITSPERTGSGVVLSRKSVGRGTGTILYGNLNQSCI